MGRFLLVRTADLRVPPPLLIERPQHRAERDVRADVVVQVEDVADGLRRRRAVQAGMVQVALAALEGDGQGLAAGGGGVIERDEANGETGRLAAPNRIRELFGVGAVRVARGDGGADRRARNDNPLATLPVEKDRDVVALVVHQLVGAAVDQQLERRVGPGVRGVAVLLDDRVDLRRRDGVVRRRGDDVLQQFDDVQRVLGLANGGPAVGVQRLLERTPHEAVGALDGATTSVEFHLVAGRQVRRRHPGDELHI